MKKALSVILVLLMLLSTLTSVSAIEIDISKNNNPNSSNTVQIEGYPEINMNGHSDFVIYREGWRSNRIELALYNTTTNQPIVLRSSSLGFDDTSLYNDDEKYYVDTGTNSWVKFETGYMRVSNHCNEIIASSRNVVDSNGNVVIKGHFEEASSPTSQTPPSDAVEFNGHFYKAFFQTVTWKRAKSLCEEMGGHLATVTSKEEDDFVYGLIESKCVVCWLGGTDEALEGEWKWITGEEWSYYPAEYGFDNRSGKQHYLATGLNGKNFWDDQSNEQGFLCNSEGYICEWEGSILSERIIATGKKTNYYGALTYETSKAGEVQDAAIEFKEALEFYFNTFSTEGQKKIGNTNSMVSLDDMAKKLRKQDEATTDKYITMADSSIPSDCYDSIYYALANFLTNVINNKVDLGKIDFSKDSTTNALKIVKAVNNGMQGSGGNTIRKGNYEITFNTLNMWGSFTGSVTAKKVSGVNSGTTYIGEIDSTMAGTQKVLKTYFDCMSDIVKDACKRALFSILSELRSVTYLAEFEQKELESFLRGKVDILQKKGYGNVFEHFLNVRTGYRTIKPFLIAKDTGSLSIVLNNAQSMYNAINQMEFYTDGISWQKKAIKEAVKMVEKARKKLANKLYNYIYNTDEPVEEEGFKGWIKNVFGIKCPVEFEIYDNDGNLIGYVDSSDKHEDYVWYTDDIYIELSGDSKFVYAPVDMELNFVFTATDDGVMNYTIERQDGEERIERLNYYDVLLTSGDTFEQCIPANTDLMAVEELPLVGDSEINYDAYLDSEDLSGHINVTCESENGLVIGEGPYPIGDLVQLVALKDYDDYTFKGWYIDDTIVETSEIYRFTAKEDVSVKAVFEKKTEIDDSYTTVYGNDYSDGYVELIKQPDEKRTIYIAVPSDELNEVAITNIKLFNDENELISSNNYNGVATSDYETVISDFNLFNADRIEIYDSTDKLVANLTKNDTLTAQQILLDRDDLSIRVNESAQLNIFPMPVRAEIPEVRWESSNPEIATVDDSGIVTAVSTGTTTIRCFVLNGEISDECEVTVSFMIGDVNLDGFVNINDVTAIQRHLCELEMLDEKGLELADTNADGVIDIADATHLQMYLAEYDVVLGKA